MSEFNIKKSCAYKHNLLFVLSRIINRDSQQFHCIVSNASTCQETVTKKEERYEPLLALDKPK